MSKPRAYIYIDAWNLFYGALSKTPFKWLNVDALAEPEPGGPTTAEVLKTEEKLTDVNLAVHMVHDAHMGRFDTAVLVSNDSDLSEPLSIVRHDIGLDVGILCPHLHAADDLERHARFVRPIRHRHLKASQFPDVIEARPPPAAAAGRGADPGALIRKPEGW